MIDFRQRAEMFVAFPKRVLAVYTDLTMPKRDWSKFDRPTSASPIRRANVAKWRLDNARRRQAAG